MKNDKKLIYGLITFGLFVLLTLATTLLVNTIKNPDDSTMYAMSSTHLEVYASACIVG